MQTETNGPKSFIKWAGSKRRMIPDLLPFVPTQFRHYHEPFAGAAWLYWTLAAEGRIGLARLNDSNDLLIRTYCAIQEDVDAVIRRLASMKNDLSLFLAQRDRDISKETDIEVACWFIYLNKTAFNGLFRVNRLGKFNVPFGKYETPLICDVDTLRSCHRTLANTATELSSEDFEKACEYAGSGDFVYLDSPYLPLSTTSSYASYTKEKFTVDDHIRLRDVALALRRKGAYVLLSNSDTPMTRELYADKFELVEVQGSRSISANGDRRKAAELLIR